MILDSAVALLQEFQRFSEQFRHFSARPDGKHLEPVGHAPRDALVELDPIYFPHLAEFLAARRRFHAPSGIGGAGRPGDG